jgi:hypothetical protein
MLRREVAESEPERRRQIAWSSRRGQPARAAPRGQQQAFGARPAHRGADAALQAALFAGWPWALRPRAPTDPDLQISRIRLVRSRVRCARPRRQLRDRKRILFAEAIKPLPGHSALAAAVEPLPPHSTEMMEEAPQRTAVAATTVIPVVPTKDESEVSLLICNRLVAVPATPLGDASQCSAEAVACGLDLHHPDPSSRLGPEVSEAKQVECSTLVAVR